MATFCVARESLKNASVLVKALDAWRCATEEQIKFLRETFAAVGQEKDHFAG